MKETSVFLAVAVWLLHNLSNVGADQQEKVFCNLILEQGRLFSCCLIGNSTLGLECGRSSVRVGSCWKLIH